LVYLLIVEDIPVSNTLEMANKVKIACGKRPSCQDNLAVIQIIKVQLQLATLMLPQDRIRNRKSALFQF